MGNQLTKLFGIAAIAVILSACGEEPKPVSTPAPAKPKKPEIKLVETPIFSQEKAFEYVQKQVDFGPRVPNSAAHKACAAWLQSELTELGWEASVQETTVKSYNGIDLEIFNVMGRFNLEAKNRILLCAHWDTRPYADRDNERQSQPIDGANDGASGVGVLLEIARVLAMDSIGPEIGVDIVFFDAEDYGKPEASMIGNSTNSWCLGSQYWSKNIPFENYKPEYGILLDMVGSGHAVFPKDGVSMYYAQPVVNKVWDFAHKMGYTNYFINAIGPELTDDHVPLNTIAKIPTIDIIHYELGRRDFGSFHHTHEDNMEGIDKTTLKVVGSVLLQTIYQED